MSGDDTLCSAQPPGKLPSTGARPLIGFLARGKDRLSSRGVLNEREVMDYIEWR